MFFGAIDSSTTSTRFLIISKEGKQCGFHQILHKQITQHQGWLEHDPIELLENTKKCMEEVQKQHPHEIKAIGITNQRETIVAWNKNTGQPYTNAIVWSDTRTIHICKRMLEQYPKDYFASRTGLPINTYFSAYKIRWMLENCPQIKEDIANVLFGTVDSWLLWNLTENRAHLTDVTNASRTNLMDLSTLQWEPEILKIFEIPLHTLPKIQPSASYFGTVSAGPYKGIDITSILGDQQAAAIGHALLNEGDCKNTQGSGLFLMANIGKVPKISKHGLLTTVLYQIEGEEAVYGFEGAVESGGQLFNWAKNKQQWFSTWEQLSESVANTEDNGGVYLVPAFSGIFTPFWNTDASGTLIGLSYFTNQDHIRRAILESVCYRTRDVIEAMESSGLSVTKIHVDGGLTQNDVLMQLQADITQKKLIKPAILEGTCLGVALFAGLQKKCVKLEELQPEIIGAFEGKRGYEKEYKQWRNALECALQFKRI